VTHAALDGVREVAVDAKVCLATLPVTAERFHRAKEFFLLAGLNSNCITVRAKRGSGVEELSLPLFISKFVTISSVRCHSAEASRVHIRRSADVKAKVHFGRVRGVDGTDDHSGSE